MLESFNSTLSHLECPECNGTYDADRPQTYCHECASPLLARYDLEEARKRMKRDELHGRDHGLWRWFELLPVRDQANIVHLGEGNSPLLKVPRLSEALGIEKLYIKDESTQPTGTFKARGMAVAVSRAKELGLTELVVPTAGNAGGALAAYAVRADIEAHVYMPKDSPPVNIAEVRATGVDLQLVEGIIREAGQAASEAAKVHGWFDMSTLKEPYRLEGKKTMGLELAADFDWQLPGVIVYPTGGGTGLLGMWKAFAELETLGWIGNVRPKMVAVQPTGCAPVVRAFNAGEEKTRAWENPQTVATGLCVPKAFADRMILEVLYESEGSAVAVSDEEILDAQAQLASLEGIFTAPEGAATLAGLKKLVEQGWLDLHARVVLFNTGSGLKYVQ
ncbi:MAG: threonine synthase [Anaerolineales bacterium]|nr:threonine synthase [Anaerolineales bacterium]